MPHAHEYQEPPIEANATTASSTPRTRKKRPDGTNDSTYDRYRRYSYKELAWEFLRRNSEYQADCDRSIDFVGDVAVEKSRIADKYGLKKLKPYRESFSKNGCPTFVGATFSVRANLPAEGEENRTIRLPITPGEVAVRFNLRAMLDGSFSLNAQVRVAKESLGKILKKLPDDNQPRSTRVVERVRLNKLIEYLKMLDHRSTGATQLDCDLLVNPAKKARLESPTEENTKEGERSNANTKLRKAVLLTTHGYLDLAVRRGYPNGCSKNNQEQVVS